MSSALLRPHRKCWSVCYSPVVYNSFRGRRCLLCQSRGGLAIYEILYFSAEQIYYLHLFLPPLPPFVHYVDTHAVVRSFARLLSKVLVLAGPGVMVATIMMATFSHYVFPYGWDWNTCLFFGAMTSATDPVAVVALMKVRTPPTTAAWVLLKYTRRFSLLLIGGTVVIYFVKSCCLLHIYYIC